MKKVIFYACSSLLLFICLASTAQEVKVKSDKDEIKVKTDNGKKKMKMEDGNKMMMDMPYKANYSSQFVMNNLAHAKKILELWKAYDENMIPRHADYFADTVTIDLPNGTRLTGKDAAMKAVTEYRSTQGKVESTVDAWIATKSVDKNEEWVCIWGVETATDASGKVTKNRIHEIWQLNKDGKVVYMAQFMATPPPM